MDFGEIFSLLYWVNSLIAIWITVNVVLDNRNPVTTFAWIFVLLFLPYIGLVLYFFFGRDTRLRKYIRRRFMSQIKRRSAFSYSSHGELQELHIPKDYARIVSFFENCAEAYPMLSSNIEVLGDTAKFMELLIEHIKTAKEHIHLQFYIFEDDELGHKVRDALVQKAREGVEVRVIYDSVGCWAVKKEFFDSIRRAGGYVESFLKVRFPLLTNKVNFRNHRKVVVIDGKVGFLGGCNVADRYLNGVNGKKWRDTMLMIHGESVYGLQTAFLADWFFSNGTMVSGKRYFPMPETSGNILMQVVVSNPVGRWRVISSGLTLLLAGTKNYVYLQTPYLMPNDKVLSALQGAALSGVDVRLMIPEHSDSRLADYASYSYLGELLQAGVKVYLHDGGFLHAKTFVADDMFSMVGSANLDFRSFEYNFEVFTCVYDANVARQMKELFFADMLMCRQYTMREYKGRSMMRKCLESAARLISPVL